MFSAASHILKLFSPLIHVPSAAEEKLLNAAKARVRRMVQTKVKRTDLAAPQFLLDEWQIGTSARTQMAMCLQEVNWNKERLSFATYIKIGRAHV